MNTRDLAFWFTLVLLMICAFLVDEIVETFFFGLIIAYAAGWVFSFFIKDRRIPVLQLIINALGIAILCWTAYSMVMYFFFYEGIVRVIITSIMIYLALLGFNAYPLRRLESIHFFTVPVFIVSLVFPPRYPHIYWSLVLTFFYVAVSFILIRLRFRCQSAEVTTRPGYGLILLLIGLLLVGAIAARLILSRDPAFEEAFKFSLYPSLSKHKLTEEKYYYLQSQLIDEFTDAGAKKISKRSEAIFFTSSLIKESAIVEEVLRAKQGLISYLGTPGLGVTENQISGMLMTLNTYLTKKAQRQISNISKNIADEVRKNELSLKDKLLASVDLNRMVHGRDHDYIEEVQESIDRRIDESPLKTPAKESLKGMVEELKQWKLLDMYREKINALQAATERAEIEEDLRAEMAGLINEIEKIPGPNGIEELKERLGTIESHRQAAEGPEEKLIDEYRDVVEIYEKLVRESQILDQPKEEARKLAELIKEKALESIVVIPAQKDLQPGEKLTLKAEARFSDGSLEDITAAASWKSVDRTIASVFEGEVTAKSEGTTNIVALFKGKESAPSVITVAEPKLHSLVVVPPQVRLTMGASTKIEVRGYYTDFNYKDLTLKAGWNIPDPENLAVEKGRVKGFRWSKSRIYATYKGLKSDPVEVTVLPTLVFLLKRIALVILIILACLFLLLLSLYERQKRRFRQLLEDDPRGFVIDLYNNARAILGVFKLPYQNHPFMAYADLVDTSTGSEAKIFSRLTTRFTQAEYSSLAFSEEETTEALREYNAMLAMLKGTQSGLSFSLRYLVIFLRRLPFFLNIKTI
ncbi:hypothetical protein ACFL5X_01695 [Candidatus Omnitrophota bacterium]